MEKLVKSGINDDGALFHLSTYPQKSIIMMFLMPRPLAAGVATQCSITAHVIPVETGIQRAGHWFPAFAGTESGFRIERGMTSLSILNTLPPYGGVVQRVILLREIPQALEPPYNIVHVIVPVFPCGRLPGGDCIYILDFVSLQEIIQV